MRNLYSGTETEISHVYLQQRTNAEKGNDAADQHSASWESSGELKCACIRACLCVWYEVKREEHERRHTATNHKYTKIIWNNCTDNYRLFFFLHAHTHTTLHSFLSLHLYKTDVCTTCVWKTNTDICLYMPAICCHFEGFPSSIHLWIFSPQKYRTIWIHTWLVY